MTNIRPFITICLQEKIDIFKVFLVQLSLQVIFNFISCLTGQCSQERLGFVFPLVFNLFLDEASFFFSSRSSHLLKCFKMSWSILETFTGVCQYCVNDVPLNRWICFEIKLALHDCSGSRSPTKPLHHVFCSRSDQTILLHVTGHLKS